MPDCTLLARQPGDCLLLFTPVQSSTTTLHHFEILERWTFLRKFFVAIAQLALEFGRRLLNESAKLAASNRVAALADQSVMMGALDMWHLETYGVKRYKANRTKVSKPRLPRPRMLWLHRDWWLNLRPKNHGQLNGWQAVHWQGAVKP